MKKSVVLTLALALFAAPAFAGITGTAHDLSSTNGTTYAGASDEICVYCHTPHGADTTVTNAPLWNRTVSNATAVYNTGTMDHATEDLALLNQSDAPLCLSCHDGASLTLGLNNEPNAGNVAIGSNIATAANLDTDLSNDHPVGFHFDSTLDNEIKDPTDARVSVAFGSGDEMWCSSCHDVHSDSASPFLAMPNNGSALCLECHVK